MSGEGITEEQSKGRQREEEKVLVVKEDGVVELQELLDGWLVVRDLR